MRGGEPGCLLPLVEISVPNERIQGIREHDLKLAVLAAQTRLVLTALGVLVTVLIAVFGFLFTR